jgi:transposase
MAVVFERCAGIEGQKRTVVVCGGLPADSGCGGATGGPDPPCGTTTGDWRPLSAWRADGGGPQVGRARTGEYGKPVSPLLEGTFTVWRLNAQQIKAVPGRKTDVKEAQWSADVLRHGLGGPRFIPPRPQRELREVRELRALRALRELTRSRTTCVRVYARAPRSSSAFSRCWRAPPARWPQSSAISEGMGVARRALLAARGAGEADPAVLAGLATGQRRKKRPQWEPALQGHLHAHQRFVLSEVLAPIERLEAPLARFDAQIREACDRQDDAAQVVALLDTIPGSAQGTAHVLVAARGTDRTRGRGAAARAAWAGRAPGNNARAGSGPPAQRPHPQGHRLAAHGPGPGRPSRRTPEAHRKHTGSTPEAHRKHTRWQPATGALPLDGERRKR